MDDPVSAFLLSDNDYVYLKYVAGIWTLEVNIPILGRGSCRALCRAHNTGVTSRTGFVVFERSSTPLDIGNLNQPVTVTDGCYLPKRNTTRPPLLIIFHLTSTVLWLVLKSIWQRTSR